MNLCQKCELLKTRAQMKEQVSQAIVHSLQIRCSWKFCKFIRKANSSGKHLCRSLFLIKLQTSGNSIKKKLQHRCFPVKFAKFLRTTFLQKSSSGCFWGFEVVFLKEFGAKTGVTVSNKYQIHLIKWICCRENLEAVTIGGL